MLSKPLPQLHFYSMSCCQFIGGLFLPAKQVTELPKACVVWRILALGRLDGLSACFMRELAASGICEQAMDYKSRKTLLAPRLVIAACQLLNVKLVAKAAWPHSSSRLQLR